MEENKSLIGWHCRYCGAENHTGTGTSYCEKCKRGHQILPNGKIIGLFEGASENTFEYTPENTLNIIAKIMLWLGIIASVIVFIVALVEEMYILLLAIPFVFLPCLITWASLRVKVNISNSLKEINQKMKSE